MEKITYNTFYVKTSSRKLLNTLFDEAIKEGWTFKDDPYWDFYKWAVEEERDICFYWNKTFCIHRGATDTRAPLFFLEKHLYSAILYLQKFDTEIIDDSTTTWYTIPLCKEQGGYRFSRHVCENVFKEPVCGIRMKQKIKN